MIYGLYLSANGVLANSFRQDVIANNLANVENVGFKRDTASFQQRFTEAQLHRMRAGGASLNPLFDNLSGGLLPSHTSIDFTQGEFESTGNNLDLAIEGSGYFAVQDGKQVSLTRDGRLSVDRDGFLVLADGSQHRVLDPKQKPIPIDITRGTNVVVGQYGEITQSGEPIGRIGLFDVTEPERLAKQGGSLLRYTGAGGLKPATGSLRSEFIERANVDPMTEIVQLMDAQRQLEANANMIRYQDQTLGRLVNDVGKIS